MSTAAVSPPPFRPPAQPQAAPAATPNEQAGTGPGTRAGQQLIEREREREQLERERAQALAQRQEQAEADRMEYVLPLAIAYQRRRSDAGRAAPVIGAEVGAGVIAIVAFTSSKGTTTSGRLLDGLAGAFIGGLGGGLVGSATGWAVQRFSRRLPANMPPEAELRLRRRVPNMTQERLVDMRAAWAELASATNVDVGEDRQLMTGAATAVAGLLRR